MAGKRCRAACDGDTLAVGPVALDGPSKRCCGTSMRPAPGMLTPAEVGRFLAQLARSFDVTCTSNALQGTDINLSVLQCFAELNLLLGQRFSSLPSNALRGYHSFTRGPKAAIWSRYALAHGMPEQLSHSLPPPGSPLHLQLVAFLLHSVFTSYPDAAIVKYTLSLPPWMAGWASRWGFATNQLSLLILEAFPAAEAGQAQGPLRTLYVPMI